MGSVDGLGSVDKRALSVAVGAVMSGSGSVVAKDSTVLVISRASLAQRARREREKFDKRERVISKVSLVQRARHEREGFAERVRLEQHIITQEQVTDKEKGQTNGKGLTTSKDKENVDPMVQLLRKNNVGVVIHEARDFNPICIHMEQEKGKEKTQTKGKGKAIAVDTENIDPMDSTVCVISRASLAQRARCEREKFGKRERIISKASLTQRARHEREGFAKRAILEQDTIAQVQLLRKNNVDVVIREAKDFNPIYIRMKQEKDKERTQTKGKGKAIAVDTENIDPMVRTSLKQSNNRINVTIFGKSDHYVKDVVELLRKENVHVHIQVEREYSSIRIREEKKSGHKFSNRKGNKFSETFSHIIFVHAPKWILYKYIWIDIFTFLNVMRRKFSRDTI